METQLTLAPKGQGKPQTRECISLSHRQQALLIQD